jgi:hypothetical protein
MLLTLKMQNNTTRLYSKTKEVQTYKTAEEDTQ